MRGMVPVRIRRRGGRTVRADVTDGPGMAKAAQSREKKHDAHATKADA